jgi:hypothetical protein
VALGGKKVVCAALLHLGTLFAPKKSEFSKRSISLVLCSLKIFLAAGACHEQHKSPIIFCRRTKKCLPNFWLKFPPSTIFVILYEYAAVAHILLVSSLSNR